MNGIDGDEEAQENPKAMSNKNISDLARISVELDDGLGEISETDISHSVLEETLAPLTYRTKVK